LAPAAWPWPDGRKVKFLYADIIADPKKLGEPPELQMKLHECFALTEHPRICEGKAAARLWLCAPDGKRLEATLDWPAFRAQQYPKLRPVLQKKYPGVAWI
jgi:ATP-dependent helicase HrpB